MAVRYIIYLKNGRSLSEKVTNQKEDDLHEYKRHGRRRYFQLQKIISTKKQASYIFKKISLTREDSEIVQMYNQNIKVRRI